MVVTKSALTEPSLLDLLYSADAIEPTEILA